MWICTIVFTLLLTAVGKAKAECNKTYTAFKDTINKDSKSQTCWYVISKNDTATNTVLTINKLALFDNDTLEISEDNQTIVSYSAVIKVGIQVVVGFQADTTIMFITKMNSSRSAWSIYYDTQECNVTINNTWSSRVDSPIYRPTASKTLSCTYIVNSNALPSQHIAVASPFSFQMKGNSSLTVSSSTNKTTYNETSARTDFFAEDSNRLVLSMNIVDTNISQSFSLRIDPVVEACSGSLSLPHTLMMKLPDQPTSYECRWLFQSDVTRPSVAVNISFLYSSYGFDRLTFIDGGSISGQVLTSVTNDVKDYLVISDQSMIISAMLGSSTKTRTISMSATESVNGGHFMEEGHLEWKEDKSVSSVYFQLIAKSGQVVKVDVMADLTEDSSIIFYDGLQINKQLIVFKNGTQNLKTVIGNGEMLIELSNFSSSSNFSANFSSIPSGCDMLVTSSSGQMFYSERTEKNCTWIIAPQQEPEGTIIIDFDDLNLGDKQTVEVYSESSPYALAQFSGALEAYMKPPQIYVPVKERARILITNNDSTKSTSKVALRYKIALKVCGGTIQNTAESILTPNYPNQYPLNAHCIWNVDIAASKFLHLSFQSKALAPNHTISVVNGNSSYSYDGVSLYPQDLPGDVILNLANKTEVEFRSSQYLPEGKNQVGGGVNITSTILDCGGSFLFGNGSFSTTNFPSKLTETTYCVWMINVKGNHLDDNTTNIVNFTIDVIDRPNQNIDSYLKIHDGNSVRSDLLSTSHKEKEYILSRTDTIVVTLNYTKSSATEVAVRITYTTKICQASERCDNGICLHPDWKCNGFDDCQDNTDERGCNGTTTTPAPITVKPSTEDSGLVKSGWIPACLFIGVLLGAILVFAVPRIIRRMRIRGGNYSRMGENTANA